MKSFVVATLMSFSTALLAWYVVHVIRARSFGSTRFFGRTLSWPDQPVGFGCGIAAYVGLVLVVSGATLGVLGELDPPLFSLWPGLLGPVAALGLSARHWGEPAPAPLLEAFAARLRTDERDSARQLSREQAPAGPARRLLEAGLDAEPAQESAADYRSSAARRWASVFDALDRAHAAERRRARLRLLPAAGAPGACLVLLARPPRADSTAAWVSAGAGLLLAALAVAVDARRARRHQDAISTLKAALRSG